MCCVCMCIVWGKGYGLLCECMGVCRVDEGCLGDVLRMIVRIVIYCLIYCCIVDVRVVMVSKQGGLYVKDVRV